MMLTANKYAALHKQSGFQTALCEEQVDAIKLAISYEQKSRYLGPLGKPHSIVVGDPSQFAAALLGDTEPIASNTVQDIPVGCIQPSPDNPRKHFEESELAELTAAILEKGVEIPIAVLPARAFGIHTLIYGERRWRASNAAGKTTIPALILDISEDRANELRLNENLQRKNLTPLEEAAAFHLRMEKYGKSLRDIAAQTGMHVRTVTRRLRLNHLPEVAKDALEAGQLSLGSALAIARLDDVVAMIETTDIFLRQTYFGYSTDEKKAAAYIEQKYFTRLAKAPFKASDLTLLPEAGSCLDCPKRTGNQSDLFDDVAETDTCLDRGCYDRKCAAQIKRELDTAEAKGLKVLTDKEIKTIAPDGFINSNYVDLSDQPWQDKKNRSWKQLLGKNAPEPVIAVVNGKIKRLVLKAAAAEVLKQQHNITIELDRKTSTGSSTAAEYRRAVKMRQAVTSESLIALHAHTLATLREKLTDDAIPFWRILGTMAIVNMRSAAQNYFTQLLELVAEKGKDGNRDFKAALEKHLHALPTAAAIAAFVVQSIAIEKLHWWTQPGGNEKPYAEHKAICETIGFDLPAAMKTAKANLTPKAKKGAA